MEDPSVIAILVACPPVLLDNQKGPAVAAGTRNIENVAYEIVGLSKEAMPFPRYRGTVNEPTVLLQSRIDAAQNAVEHKKERGIAEALHDYRLAETPLPDKARGVGKERENSSRPGRTCFAA